MCLYCTGGIWQRLESTGPQLGGEILRAVLFAVALEHVEGLQTQRLHAGNVDKEEGREREITNGRSRNLTTCCCDVVRALSVAKQGWS